MESIYQQAHKHSSNNRKQVMHSKQLGCFYCVKLFTTDQFDDEWEGIDQNTAICPFCSIDSVLPEHPSYPLSKEFLHEMKRVWFGDL